LNTKQLFLIGGKEDKGDRPLLLEFLISIF